MVKNIYYVCDRDNSRVYFVKNKYDIPSYDNNRCIIRVNKYGDFSWDIFKKSIKDYIKEKGYLVLNNKYEKEAILDVEFQKEINDIYIKEQQNMLKLGIGNYISDEEW